MLTISYAHNFPQGAVQASPNVITVLEGPDEARQVQLVKE